MDKLITFDGYDRHGPHIFPLETTPVRMIKLATAIHPDVQAYINKAKPIPGKTQMLIDALGASEYWGQNVNGDLFPEAALEHEGPDYGARTFELYAHPFKHHVNKDPDRAYGDKVTMARYFKPTGRVQLIVAYHNDKAKDIIEDVDNGDYPAVSMGARVPFDVCTICGNRAKTRANYCEHGRMMMGKILSDGRQVGVVNTMPKFFDISVVLIGAEKASHVLKKVAHAGRSHALSSAEDWEKLSASLKAATQTKGADISKDVPSNLPPKEQVRPVSEIMDGASDLKATEKTLPKDVVDQLAQVSHADLFSTLAALGLPLKPHEFQRVMLLKLGQRKLADDLWESGTTFDETSGGVLKSAAAFTFSPRALSEKVAYALRPYLTERSIYPELIEARANNFEKRAEDWYNTKANRPPSPLPSLLPTMIAMASAYRLFKDRLPEVQKGAFERAVEANPWLLPLLLGVGVAAKVGAKAVLAPIQLHSQGPFDQNALSKYALEKSAWKRLGVIPAAYAYSGVQRHRAMRGDHLNWLDRKVAERPELAALGAYLATPGVAKAAKRVGLLKGASLAGDAAMMSFASGPKFVPGVLAGLAIDVGVAKGLQQIAKRRSRNGHHA